MSSPHRSDFADGIARSAAFRLTLCFVATFVICLLLVDVVVGTSTRWLVRRHAIASIEDTIDTLQAAHARGGIAAVAEAIGAGRIATRNMARPSGCRMSAVPRSPAA